MLHFDGKEKEIWWLIWWRELALMMIQTSDDVDQLSEKQSAIFIQATQRSHELHAFRSIGPKMIT
jgi:hypothetical protein